MKMKAKKPFWHAGSVVLPGQDFETLELVTRNIAQAIKVDSKPAADKPAAKPKAVKKAD